VIEVWGCNRTDGDYDAGTQDQRDNYATHGSIRFSRDATPLKVNAHLVCFKVAAKRSRDFFCASSCGRMLRGARPPEVAISGGTEVSILLTRLYAPSGDFTDLLTRQEPAIGPRS
jgi:hypothetical protein